jgi:hypothetical protein
MATNELGIWKPGPDPAVEPVTPLDQMLRDMADTSRDAILSASTVAPAHLSGRWWYNPTTKRTYRSDGTLWKYMGGGGQGDPVSAGTLGIEYTYAGYGVPGSLPPRPLKLTRTGEGMALLLGTIMSNTVFSGWTLNTQYLMARIATLAPEYIPATDIMGVGGVTVAGVTAVDPCLFVIRGAAAGSTYTGVAGEILWQPTVTRAGSYTAGSVYWQFPTIMWDMPV